MSIDLAIADVPAARASGAAVPSAKRSIGRPLDPTSPAADAGEELSPGSTVAGEGRAAEVRAADVRAADVRAMAKLPAESSLSTPASTVPPGAAARALTADLIQLTKPRIVVMVLVTAVASAVIAAGGLIAGVDLMWLLIGTGLVAGSAGAANQIWERHIDAVMPRTAMRPLPGQRMHVATAIAFTAGTGVIGSAVLLSRFGFEAAAVGIATWALYVLAYTPLKTRTQWNTTVGAVAGALPILIGYAALGGSLTDATGWLLVGVLVAWQYPHFMAIAWMYRRQYAEAGFCMTTTVEPTGWSAAAQSIAGSVALAVCGVVLCIDPAQPLASLVSAIAVLAMVHPMFRASLGFARQRDDQQARRLLRSSLLVLPTVLLIVTLRVFW